MKCRTERELPIDVKPKADKATSPAYSLVLTESDEAKLDESNIDNCPEK
jgi:hypothetical protein